MKKHRWVWQGVWDNVVYVNYLFCHIQINGISVIECFEDVGFVKMCRLAQCEGSFRGLIATLIQVGVAIVSITMVILIN